MNVGEIAYNHDEIFNTDIAANCNFDFLWEMDCFLSNSFAVSVAAAHINNLLNSEKLTPSEVFSRIKALPEYTGSASLFAETVQTMKLMDGINPKSQPLIPYWWKMMFIMVLAVVIALCHKPCGEQALFR